MAIITVDTTTGLGDYSSAAAALLALDGVTLTETTTITCAATDGYADTSPLVIPDVTAAADKRLVLAAADGHHAGVAWDESKYRLSLGSVNTGIDVGKFYISLIGLQVEHSCPSYGATIRQNSGSGDLYIEGCYARNLGSYVGVSYGIGGATSVDLRHGITVVNSIVDGPYGTGIYATGNSNDSVYGLVYNCTAVGCHDVGIDRGSNGVAWSRTAAINCLEQNCGGSSLDSTSFASATDYNITNVDITPIGANSLGNTTVGFVSGTYQPVSGSAADGAGTDLSAYFTTDILGNTRTVPWDVGAANAAASSNNTGNIVVTSSNCIVSASGTVNAPNTGSVALDTDDATVAVSGVVNAPNTGTVSILSDDTDISIIGELLASGLVIHTFLEFENAADLGADSSGNGNDWTLTSASQSTDTPTNNHCTLNPLDPLTTGTLSDGNLTTTGDATVTMRPDAGQWYYEKDGVGVSYDADTSGQFNPTLAAGTYNFGGTAWADTGPTGTEKPLRDSSLPEPDILDPSAHYHVSLFTAGATAQDITVGFDAGTEDWLLVLKGLGTQPWYWVNTVCGLDKAIDPASTAGEFSLTTPVTVSGKTITIPSDMLTSGTAYSVMVLKAGSDTGLDIVTYTGDGATPHMLGHTLDSLPVVIAVLGRSDSSAKSMYWEKGGIGYRYDLSTAGARAAGIWGGVEPTSTQFAVSGTDANCNAVGNTYVAFLFAQSDVVSDFSYLGNGLADGVYCGTPLAIERIEFLRGAVAAHWWNNLDTTRNPVNPIDRKLLPHDDVAEQIADTLAMTSSGFKIITTATAINASGEEFMGLGFGKQLKYRNAF